ncbi:hypothetical protein TNCV_3634111 [Trichonephila clavipes]|nr:hypothetical protein TNCV_3634111 [Trichonephila clavipes]
MNESTNQSETAPSETLYGRGGQTFLGARRHLEALLAAERSETGSNFSSKYFASKPFPYYSHIAALDEAAATVGQCLPERVRCCQSHEWLGTVAAQSAS